MASTNSFFVPVLVEYKKQIQKLKFRLNKSVQQTLTAILRTLKIDAEPSKWGLFRVSRQAWLPPYKTLVDLDIEMLETLILAPRQNILARRLERLGIPQEEMDQGETRVVRVETMAGTHKTVRYEFEASGDQIISRIMKKDPVPDWQNYQLRYPAVESKTSGAIFLAGTEQVALYRIPNNTELKLIKMRVRFNCRIMGPDGASLGELNVILPLECTVADGIEYLYLQVDPKAKISSEKEKLAIAQKWGMYLASDTNEHGFSMLPSRTIESYKVKPDDWVVFKRRPKDKVDLLLQSHEKLRAAAANHTFVKVVCEPTKGVATFKFASSVSVQQAISKCSRKFDLYGAYGLWLPSSPQNKKAIWLEPAQLFSSYNIENMSLVYFKDRPGAKPTTPNDDLGEADTTVKPEKGALVGAAAVLEAAKKEEEAAAAGPKAPPDVGGGVEGDPGHATPNKPPPIGLPPQAFSNRTRSGRNPELASQGEDKPVKKTDTQLLEEILGDIDLGVDVATVLASGSSAAMASAAAGGEGVPCPECGYHDYEDGKYCPECSFNSAISSKMTDMEMAPPTDVNKEGLADEPVIELDSAPLEEGGEVWADIEELLDFDVDL